MPAAGILGPDLVLTEYCTVCTVSLRGHNFTLCFPPEKHEQNIEKCVLATMKNLFLRPLHSSDGAIIGFWAKENRGERKSATALMLDQLVVPAIRAGLL